MNVISTVTIRSPDKTFDYSQVESMSVVTEKGPMVIYAKHASLTSTISFSLIHIKHGLKESSFMVRNGFLFINNDQNTVTILASTIDQVAEVTVETIEGYLERIKAQLDSGEILLPIQYKYLENERLTLKEQLKVIKKSQ